VLIVCEYTVGPYISLYIAVSAEGLCLCAWLSLSLWTQTVCLCNYTVYCLYCGRDLIVSLIVFVVDTRLAGEAGRLAVDVRGFNTHPLASVTQKLTGVYTVSFVPQESVEHSVVVTFNNIPVPGEQVSQFLNSK